jgi:hypothetical protein
LKRLKKSPELKAVNEAVLATLEPTQTIVRLCLAQDQYSAIRVNLFKIVELKRLVTGKSFETLALHPQPW